MTPSNHNKEDNQLYSNSPDLNVNHIYTKTKTKTFIAISRLEFDQTCGHQRPVKLSHKNQPSQKPSHKSRVRDRCSKIRSSLQFFIFNSVLSISHLPFFSHKFSVYLCKSWCLLTLLLEKEDFPKPWPLSHTIP